MVIPEAGKVVDHVTTIDRWAFTLLCITGSLVLVFCLYGGFDYIVNIRPALPKVSGTTVAEVQNSVNQHKLIAEELRAPFWATFDLTVSRTLLPFVSLFVGYLFGKSKH
jgi:hypothetical protein